MLRERIDLRRAVTHLIIGVFSACLILPPSGLASQDVQRDDHQLSKMRGLEPHSSRRSSGGKVGGDIFGDDLFDPLPDYRTESKDSSTRKGSGMPKYKTIQLKGNTEKLQKVTEQPPKTPSVDPADLKKLAVDKPDLFKPVGSTVIIETHHGRTVETRSDQKDSRTAAKQGSNSKK